MSLNETRIDIPAEHVSNIFGQFDHNIKLIERTLNVTVVPRNEGIKVIGDTAIVEGACKVFAELLQLAERGNMIDEQKVAYTLSLLGEHKEGSLVEIDKDCICHTINGKPVKPKTLGQKAYVDAIRKQMIVFGIGPAGTGKTYLAMAMAITAVGCGSKTENTADTQKNTETAIVNTESTVETEAVAETESVDAAVAQEIILGEGSVKFTFIVVDADGNETNFVVSTDKETVGDALLELNLIEGEEGDYGLYVKTVNGITADYDTDHTYWAFYVNGEYSNTGVDSTPVNEGDTYEFKVEK